MFSGNYDNEIVNGIENTRAMIVLVSDQSNNSLMVRKKIELAINHGNPIFPIRIQNVEPEKKLKFC